MGLFTQIEKEHNMECVNPSAPVEKCVVCGKDVYTCENEDGPCPVHPDGAEIDPGRWVCSHECWEVVS